MSSPDEEQPREELQLSPEQIKRIEAIWGRPDLDQAAKLLKMRLAADVTQLELSAKSGVHPATLSRAESGKAPPSPLSLNRILKSFRIADRSQEMNRKKPLRTRKHKPLYYEKTKI